MTFRRSQKQRPWIGSLTRPSTAEPTVRGSIRPEKVAVRTGARTFPPTTDTSPDPKSKQRKTNRPRRRRSSASSLKWMRGFPDSRKVIVFSKKNIIKLILSSSDVFSHLLRSPAAFRCLNLRWSF